MAGTGQEKRRRPRIALHDVHTDAEVAGARMAVRVTDLSEHGVRIALDEGVDVEPDEEVRVAVGRISPNIRGRVRWVAPDRRQMGVEFESLLIEVPEAREVQDLLEVWRETSATYSVFESFLHVLDALDFDIVDGAIDDLADAVYSVAVWLNQRLGAVSLWSVIEEADGSRSTHLIVDRAGADAPPMDERERRAREVAGGGTTRFFGGQPYLHGEAVVVECTGQPEPQIDLLEKIAVLLGKRVQLWSKLLIKNIALQLLGEEVERSRKG